MPSLFHQEPSEQKSLSPPLSASVVSETETQTTSDSVALQPLPVAIRRLVAGQKARCLFMQSIICTQGGLFILLFILLAQSGWLPKAYDPFLMCAGILSCIGSGLLTIPISKAWANGARRLTDQHDTRLLGPLLETFGIQYQHKSTPQLDTARAEARRGLLEILPRVGAAELPYLSFGQRRLLHTLVARSGKFYSYEDRELSVAILEALERGATVVISLYCAGLRRIPTGSAGARWSKRRNVWPKTWKPG